MQLTQVLYISSCSQISLRWTCCHPLTVPQPGELTRVWATTGLKAGLPYCFLLFPTGCHILQWKYVSACYWTVPSSNSVRVSSCTAKDRPSASPSCSHILQKLHVHSWGATPETAHNITYSTKEEVENNSMKRYNNRTVKISSKFLTFLVLFFWFLLKTMTHICFGF